MAQPAEDYLKRLDEGDVAEAGINGARTKNLGEKIEALCKKRGQYGALLADLERSGESQVSLTATDSRAMAAHTKVVVGYNVQVAIDARNKMIVEQEVTNQVVDMGLLQETAEPARAILEVDRIDVVADAGYFRTEGELGPAIGASADLRIIMVGTIPPISRFIDSNSGINVLESERR